MLGTIFTVIIIAIWVGMAALCFGTQVLVFLNAMKGWFSSWGSHA